MLNFNNEKLNKEINEIIMIENIQKGTFLGFEGEYCQNFPIIKHGKVKAFKTDNQGKEIDLYTIKDGEGCILTFKCIFNNEPLSANLIVEENSEIYFIPRTDFKNFFEKYSEFRNFIMSIILQNLDKKFLSE